MSIETQATTVDSDVAQSVQLTPAAIAHLKTLLDQTEEKGLNLRVRVMPGGCAGLQYDLQFDDQVIEGDTRTEFDGVGVVVDRMSAPHLGGATIDWVDTFQKQSFTIDNPNATSGCGCGNSFC